MWIYKDISYDCMIRR